MAVEAVSQRSGEVQAERAKAEKPRQAERREPPPEEQRESRKAVDAEQGRGRNVDSVA